MRWTLVSDLVYFPPHPSHALCGRRRHWVHGGGQAELRRIFLLEDEGVPRRHAQILPDDSHLAPSDAYLRRPRGPSPKIILDLLMC